MSDPPLSGKRVLLPRAEGQAEEAAALLRERGALPVVLPTVSIEPADPEALASALLPSRLAGVDCVVFTSANGVAFTWRALRERGLGREVFGQARFAVVGTATEEALAKEGVTASLVAREFRGEGLARAILAGERPRRVLLLRAQDGSLVLPEALREAGVAVDVVAAYRTRPILEAGALVAGRLRRGEIDAVIFSSGSTVNAVCAPMGSEARELLARVLVACIGPVTAKAAEARGIRVDVVPAVATFPAAILALEDHARGSRAI